MNVDTYTVASFRRSLGVREPGFANEQFENLGETTLGSVPAKGEEIWIDGKLYRVESREWSLELARPGQPSFSDPQVLITVVLVYNDGDYARKDFRGD